MSKNLPKNKSSYHNYLTLSNNCKIVANGAKPLPHLNPQNILTDNIREVWLSNQLPAVCIIDGQCISIESGLIAGISTKIQYSKQSQPDDRNWTVLSKIRLQLASGWQHFKVPLVLAKNISYLKVNILQNHAQSQLQDYQDQGKNVESSTYLNQVSLGYVEETVDSRLEPVLPDSRVQPRQKTFSDYRKLTASQKQIKKLIQKVRQLSNQNQAMKKTIDHQTSIIFKLQQAMQSLTKNVSRLQKTQILQQNKLKGLDKNTFNIKRNSETTYKQKIKQFFNDESQMVQSVESKNHSKDKEKFYSRHNSIYEQNQSQFSKPNSIYKSGKGKSLQKSNNSKKRKIVNDDIEQSQDNLSQFQEAANQKAYHFNVLKQKQKNAKKEKTYIPMLQKLQQLIILRDQKKNKLKTHKKSRGSQNVVISSQEQDDQDQDY